MGFWKKGLASLVVMTALMSVGAQAETVYSVKEGDTIQSVAKAHQTTEDLILKLNPHLAEKGFLPGLIIILPDDLAAEVKAKEEQARQAQLAQDQNLEAPEAKAVPVSPEERAKIAREKRRRDLASRRGKRVQAITATAHSYLGTPYLMGGTTRRAIDCSAFTQNVYRAHGIRIPRTADYQYYDRQGKTVARGQEKPGDLVFFETYLPGPSHCGIYLGKGKFIHASSSRGVTITPLNSYYFGPRYLGAKRFF